MTVEHLCLIILGIVGTPAMTEAIGMFVLTAFNFNDF